MDEKTAALLTEQLRHANHLLGARIKVLETRLTHTQALNNQRLALLESQIRDHETRLRAATEGVTQFKLFSGLASGGSGLMSLAAVIKAFFGG
jgi:hypothetical protein